MRPAFRTSIFLVLLSAGLLASAATRLGASPPSIEQTVSTQLAAFYKDFGDSPPYAAAIDDLSSESKATRKSAGEYLHVLLVQLDADVRNGRAPWVATPFWGEGARSPASELRTTIARKLGERASGDEAVEAARWLIERDAIADDQVAGMRVVVRTSTPRATEVLRDVLDAPHPNGKVLTLAILEAERRNGPQFRTPFLRLCGHHRAPVREFASDAARRIGVHDLPEYLPERAFTPQIERALASTLRRIRTVVPAGATWCRFEVTDIPAGGTRPWTRRGSGWLLETSAEEYRVLDWFARDLRLAREKTRVQESSLHVAGDELGRIRTAGPDSVRRHLSVEGDLTAQFEADGPTLPEVLVAAWSFERGDRATAAAVLFPALDELMSDADLDPISLHALGTRYEHLMLETFACRRDYAGTIAIAHFLSGSQFDGFLPQRRAKELASQLEHRRDDFTSFALPDSLEWRRLRREMSRAEQIAHLVERLRLLNCFQAGQPGGVWFGSTQRSRPLNGEGPWCAGADESSPPVINPHETLAKMQLGVADLAALAPGLMDTSFLPTFEFWRDFHPGRHLFRVNEVVASFIQEITVEGLVDDDEIGEWTDSQRRAAVDRVLTWAKDNNRPIEERMLRILATSSDYESLWGAQRWAVESKSEASIPLLFMVVDRLPKFASSFAAAAYKIDSPAAVPGARAHLHDARGPVRYSSALILLRHGSRDSLEGLETIRELGQLPDGPQVIGEAFDELLATGQKPAIELASTILDMPVAGSNDSNRLYKVRKLMNLGQREARDFLWRELADTSFGGTRWGTTPSGQDLEQRLERGDVAAEDVAMWRDSKARFGWYEPVDARRRERQELSAWIGREFERVERERAQPSQPH